MKFQIYFYFECNSIRIQFNHSMSDSIACDNVWFVSLCVWGCFSLMSLIYFMLHLGFLSLLSIVHGVEISIILSNAICNTYMLRLLPYLYISHDVSHIKWNSIRFIIFHFTRNGTFTWYTVPLGCRFLLTLPHYSFLYCILYCEPSSLFDSLAFCSSSLVWTS